MRFLICILADTGTGQTHIYLVFPGRNFVQGPFEDCAQNQTIYKIFPAVKTELKQSSLEMLAIFTAVWRSREQSIHVNKWAIPVPLNLLQMHKLGVGAHEHLSQKLAVARPCWVPFLTCSPLAKHTKHWILISAGTDPLFLIQSTGKSHWRYNFMCLNSQSPEYRMWKTV